MNFLDKFFLPKEVKVNAQKQEVANRNLLMVLNSKNNDSLEDPIQSFKQSLGSHK